MNKARTIVRGKPHILLLGRTEGGRVCGGGVCLGVVGGCAGGCAGGCSGGECVVERGGRGGRGGGDGGGARYEFFFFCSYI